MKTNNAADEQALQITLGEWVIKPSTQTGGLTLIVCRESDLSRSVTIDVGPQLQVEHNAKWPSQLRRQLELMIPRDAAGKIAAQETADTIVRMLELCEQDAAAAEHLLRCMQGYLWVTSVQFGSLPYWERGGERCDAPASVPRALAAAITMDILGRALELRRARENP